MVIKPGLMVEWDDTDPWVFIPGPIIGRTDGRPE